MLSVQEMILAHPNRRRGSNNNKVRETIARLGRSDMRKEFNDGVTNIVVVTSNAIDQVAHACLSWKHFHQLTTNSSERRRL